MAQSFEDYLNSLGAKSVNLGYGSVAQDFSDLGGNFRTTLKAPHTPTQTFITGEQRNISPPNYRYGEKPYIGGPYGSPGYVDASGGFLGYGASPSELTNPSLLRGYSDFIAQDPAREAQQIANRQAEQNLFQQQLEARRRVAAERQANMPTIGQGGNSTLTGIPGGTGQFGGFGGPMPGFRAQQQAQGGLLGGLHRGKFGGTGLLGGNE